MAAPLNPNDPNVAQLELVARHLGEALRQQLVFVGGAVAGLLITDPAQPAIRPTEDVDLVAHVLARIDYYELERALRERGFAQDMRPDAPICRWMIERVTVDVMPTLDEVLGFSNRWYAMAVETAQGVTLPSGAKILVITAPAFVATKLEAFAGRGGGDYLFSHDLGDIISGFRHKVLNQIATLEDSDLSCLRAHTHGHEITTHWPPVALTTLPAFQSLLIEFGPVATEDGFNGSL
jgi:predicted nucleotidyltransferase